MKPLNDQLAREFKTPSKDGVLVSEVLNGGGAEKGGIKAYDVITELNGQKVASLEEFRNTIAGMAPGVKVDLTIYRDGQEKKLAVTLVERPAKGDILNVTPPPVAVKVPDVLDGVTVSDLTPEARKQFRIGDEVQGALITQVSPDSPSAEAEIHPGDVVVDIAGKPVKNSEDAIKLSEEVKMKSSVHLRVNTKGVTRVVVVEERKDN
jgi:serine protease Do